MRTLKFIIAILLFAGAVSAQPKWEVENTQGGTSARLTFLDLDSTESPTSEWEGWLTNYDANTVTLSYRFYATNDTVAEDSIKVIIQGKSDDSLIYDCDTILVIGSATVTRTALSLTAYAPMYRVKIIDATGSGGEPTLEKNNNNARVLLGFFANEPDYVPPFKRYETIYP